MTSVVLSSCGCSAPRITNIHGPFSTIPEAGFLRCCCSKRDFMLKFTAAIPYFAVNLSLPFNSPPAFAGVEPPPSGDIQQTLPQPQPRKPVLQGIANTSSWFQFFGDGFAIRVPPLFEDVTEPEDYNAGLSLYGDKAKPKTFAARFASPDRSELLSIVIRPSNQLKITFLEAKDISDLGSLKAAAQIFVPGGATLFSARTIKIKEDDSLRNYYYYEFGIDDQHVALMTGINSGKTFIAGAAAPQSKWDEDGVKLRSAAISLSLL